MQFVSPVSTRPTQCYIIRRSKEKQNFFLFQGNPSIFHIKSTLKWFIYERSISVWFDACFEQTETDLISAIQHWVACRLISFSENCSVRTIYIYQEPCNWAFFCWSFYPAQFCILLLTFPQQLSVFYVNENISPFRQSLCSSKPFIVRLLSLYAAGDVLYGMRTKLLVTMLFNGFLFYFYFHYTCRPVLVDHWIVQ